MNPPENEPPCHCGATPEADCWWCGAPYITGNYPDVVKFPPPSNEPPSVELLAAEARLTEVESRLPTPPLRDAMSGLTTWERMEWDAFCRGETGW